MTCSAVYFLYPAPKKAQHFPENNSVLYKTALGKKEASLCHPHSKIQYGREGVSHCHQGYSLIKKILLHYVHYTIAFTYPDWEKLHDFDFSYCLIIVMSCQTITPAASVSIVFTAVRRSLQLTTIAVILHWFFSTAPVCCAAPSERAKKPKLS